MRAAPLLAVAALLAAFPAAASDRRVEPATPLAALASMPIREVTVFKDGHAFVVHSGTMPTDAAGNVLLDDLPVPVLGTFWPFAKDPRARLASVTAGKRRVLVTRTALELVHLLLANVGAEAWVTEKGGGRYPATVLGVPARSTEELARTTPPGTEVPLPQYGRVVLLRTAEGTKVLPLDRIEDVTFKGEAKTALATEETRDLLTLRLVWGAGKPAPTAEIGMGYLQKGLRWIPSYRVEIDGEGKASLRLQATLVNDLADLEGVTLHLVIGVPSFDFRETLDPIALQRTLAGLSPYFQTSLSNAAIASNFIVSQQVMRSGELREGNAEAPGGPEGQDTPGEKSEDLFVFTLQGITLRKGERMVLPVAEASLPYRDAYTLELPFSPPPEVERPSRDARTAELARLLAAPKVQHKLRIENSGKVPLTTAPALILKGGQVLGQGTMTYTAPGATVDLAITTAVDVKVKRSDRETGRTPDAAHWNGNSYFRVDLEGSIVLTNRKERAVEVEVVRWVLGAVDSANAGGTAEAVSLHEDDEWTSARPAWWGWYGGWSWPNWWAQMNGVGKVTWKATVEPGKTETLGYKWHYHWR